MITVKVSKPTETRVSAPIPACRALVAAVLLASVSVGCGFETRSDDFECTDRSQCKPWQLCSGGKCLVGGTECHPSCDGCENGVCVINCNGFNSCASEIVCPPSRVCRVDCSGTNSCQRGIDCNETNRCELSCTGQDACAGGIDCGIGDCSVNCAGPGACADALDCSSSCSCVTNCRGSDGSRTCVPECPLESRCVEGSNCSNEGAGCNTCDSQ